ncbi:CDP-alcohol phosphatidyltransferase family protein [Flavobacteriaceae bacterium F08102]|nr:CDP-alcohol phosphatidyltransferase family protein [Flavobacteriaceae bacterium F08102]
MKKHIPNFITLLNLFCGTIAVMFAVVEQYEYAALFVLMGIFFDFFDGLVARLLNVQSKLGLELDSLADLVTSCVVPGIVMYHLLSHSVRKESFAPHLFEAKTALFNRQIAIEFTAELFIPLVGILLTLAGAYRLAKFNLDDRQSTSFVGLPVPAMALFMLSLPLIQLHSDVGFLHALLENPYVLIGIVVLFSFLMNAELPLFSLKFKKPRKIDIVFPILLLFLSLLAVLFFQWVAIPLIILLYVLLSMIQNFIVKKSPSH